MSDHYDGGSAFPVANMGSANPGGIEEGVRMARGMTLRDYFAAAALQGILGRPQSSPGDHKKEPAGFAAFAYECADAMLKTRTAR